MKKIDHVFKRKPRRGPTWIVIHFLGEVCVVLMEALLALGKQSMYYRPPLTIRRADGLVVGTREEPRYVKRICISHEARFEESSAYKPSKCY